MKFLLFIASIHAAVLFAADFDPARYDEGEYEGVLYQGFEVSNFQPCQNKERWWLKFIEADDYERVSQVAGSVEGTTIKQSFVRMRAYVTPDDRRVAGYSGGLGGYGHLGAYNREIYVATVREARAATAAEIERCTVERDRGYPSEKRLGL